MKSQVISDGSYHCRRSLGWKFNNLSLLLDLKTGSVEETAFYLIIELEYCYLSGMLFIAVNRLTSSKKFSALKCQF